MDLMHYPLTQFIQDINVPDHVWVRRPWKDRLFSRPWKPWISRVWTFSPIAYSLGDKWIVSPLTYQKIQRDKLMNGLEEIYHPIMEELVYHKSPFHDLLPKQG